MCGAATSSCARVVASSDSLSRRAETIAICARTDRSRRCEAVEVRLKIVDRHLLRNDAAECGELNDRLLDLGNRDADEEGALPSSPVATFAVTTWPPSDSVRSSAFCADSETPSESATSTVSVALIRCARPASGPIDGALTRGGASRSSPDAEADSSPAERARRGWSATAVRRDRGGRRALLLEARYVAVRARKAEHCRARDRDRRGRRHRNSAMRRTGKRSRGQKDCLRRFFLERRSRGPASAARRELQGGWL